MTAVLAAIAPYRKPIVGVAIALLGWGSSVTISKPAPVTSAEWIALGFAFLGGLGVYTARNDPPS